MRRTREQIAIQKAVKLAGGPTALARKMLGRESGRKVESLRASIHYWMHVGVPPRWVLQVSFLTGVSPQELAPYLYYVPTDSPGVELTRAPAVLVGE